MATAPRCFCEATKWTVLEACARCQLAAATGLMIASCYLFSFACVVVVLVVASGGAAASWQMPSNVETEGGG